MGFPCGLLVPAVLVSLATCHAAPAAAQPHPPETATLITALASLAGGSINGVVLDEGGHPLKGVVVSAQGGGAGFDVTDQHGRFVLGVLPPGPYLVRAYLLGYLPARSTMVEVRSSGPSAASFTMRRASATALPRVSVAGVGGPEIGPVSAELVEDRDESERAWRLRHLRRPVLKDLTGVDALYAEDDSSVFAESFARLGRAVGGSARLASAFFIDTPFQGEVNLLTTGAFDGTGQIFDIERARSVTFLSLGAPVGEHGDWTVNAALNQGDLDSWILTSRYNARASSAHRYTFGMSYGLQRYRGGNSVALAALPDAARNVGAVFAFDEWTVSRRWTVGYGAAYAHYDYLQEPSLFSPRLSATYRPTERTQVRAVATRQVAAPGAEEFLPPTRTQGLPPQRTFAPLSSAGFLREGLDHFEIAVERAFDSATVGVRAYAQQVDDQSVTLFGLRTKDSPASELGHYFVATAGDADMRGWGVTVTHDFAEHVRGSVDYSQTMATWHDSAAAADRAALSVWMPSALRIGRERVHDITTYLDSEIPQTDTRIFVLYKINSAFVGGDGAALEPGVGYRFDVQVSQGLPFMAVLNTDWEMLMAVSNVFCETVSGGSSIYDEILVARPPKRMVGGLTVKF